MFCPQCGAPNEDDAIFCGNCGAVLKPEELPVEAAPDTATGTPPEEFDAAAAIPPQEPEGDEGLYQETARDESVFRSEPVRQAQVLPPPAPPRMPGTAATTLPTSGMAIASLVLGIGGLTILPLLGSILAVLFGYMARNEIRRRPNAITGEGLATAGIVLGWISIGLAVLGLLLFGAFSVCGICGALGASNY